MLWISKSIYLGGWTRVPDGAPLLLQIPPAVAAYFNLFFSLLQSILVEASSAGDSKDAQDRLMMRHTVTTVELILELIMNFAKTVPEFRDLLPEDKVILLQVSRHLH